VALVWNVVAGTPLGALPIHLPSPQHCLSRSRVWHVNLPRVVLASGLAHRQLTQPVLLSKHVLPLSARPLLPQNGSPLGAGCALPSWRCSSSCAF